MKTIAITLAILLGITLGASAQNGGLFGKGPERGDSYRQRPRRSPRQWRLAAHRLRSSLRTEETKSLWFLK